MSEAWSAQDVREWLAPAFEWLEREAADEESEREWDGDLSRGFLEQLGLADETEFPVVAKLFERLRAMPSDVERSDLLLDEAQRGPVLDELITAWEAGQAAAAADEPEQPEPYWDGEKWLNYNAETEEWEPMHAESEEGAAAETAEPSDETAGEAAALPSPEQLSADLVETIVGPAVAELVATVPAVANMSSETLHALLSEVVTERVGAAR